MKTFKIIPWCFDGEGWAAAVKDANEQLNGGLHLFIEVSPSAVDNWANARYHESAPWPNMTNLLKFCNLMDRDPREFFVLEVK